MFEKQNTIQVDKVVEQILNAHGNSTIIVRNTERCKVLFANNAAKTLLNNFYLSGDDCKKTFAKIFPEICDYCVKRNQYLIDIKNTNGHTFSLIGKRINWFDGKPATIFNLSDVEEERSQTKMLYKLAYNDYLTQIPNRRKLKEDFKELEPAIIAGKKSGVIAIFDLDHFKDINDAYGHNTGDMMLQRLTQHLQNNPVYDGHLYRLGGDEFVLLYADNKNAVPDLREYYKDILAGVLQNYTLPNIKLSCRVSMGVSFFPEHGEDLYTLLRKADIALYKAKDSGRNRLAIFEKRFDVIQEFKDIYINIQPIIDATGNTFGYELTEESAEISNEDQLVHLLDFNRTLDILDLDAICNQQLYFINYTPNIVTVTEQYQLKFKFVIQIDGTKPYRAEDLKNYNKLKELGFSISVNCRDINLLLPELIEVAQYVKITSNQATLQNIKKLRAINKEIIPIADHINDEKQLELAKKAGCNLYKGYYFRAVKKVVEKIKSIEPLHANYYRLLKLTSTTDEYFDFNKISEIISSDPSLSYRLLKMLNTIEFRTRHQISSIKEALAHLGEQHLKKWIALMSLRGIASNKPMELVRLSIIRAKFGELLAPNIKVPLDSDRVFMIALLSLLHVILDKTQEELTKEIVISDEIRQSLLTKNGKYSALLEFFKSYEHCDWEEVTQFAKNNGLGNKMINESYITAVKWYNELIAEM